MPGFFKTNVIGSYVISKLFEYILFFRLNKRKTPPAGRAFLKHNTYKKHRKLYQDADAGL